MTNYSGLDARRALITWFGANAADHPDLAMIVSKPDWIASTIEGTEYLYAHRARLDPAGLELLEDLARFISSRGFWGKAERMAAIAGVAARIARGGDAETASDPELAAQFAVVRPAGSTTPVPGAGA